MIYLYCNPTCKCFIPFLSNFKYILDKQGISSTIVHDIDPQSTDLWFVIWNNIDILPRKCIIYNMDPMVSVLKNELQYIINRSSESKVLEIVNYCYGKTFDIIKEFGIHCSVMPYGYSSFHKLPIRTKDIDILFYGNISPRRYEYLQHLNILCQKNNYNLVIYNNNLYDDTQKKNVIASAKIIVSIASKDAKAIETNDLARSSQVISGGGFIITEFIGDREVEFKMKEYVPHFSTKEEMADLVEYYLKNQDFLVKKSELATAQFSKDFNLETSFVELIQNYI